jgi:hypothetical protein
MLNRMVNGLPALLVSPTCPTLIDRPGRRLRLQAQEGLRLADLRGGAGKNEFSHPIDAMLETSWAPARRRETLGRERKGIIRTQPKTDAFGRTLRAAGGRR